MGAALTLLGILAGVVVIPRLASRLVRRYQSDVDDYRDEQHRRHPGIKGSWPVGGGHIGMGLKPRRP